MVSNVGYGTASAPSTHRASVSGESSAQAAQAPAVNLAGAVQSEGKQDAATKAARPGVTVSISPEGAAAASRAQQAQTLHQTDSTTASASGDTAADTPDSADVDSGDDGDGDIGDAGAAADATDGAQASDAKVSPVTAFAYGALGLERPDQPPEERNGFYTAGKWLAAGLTIGGLISLLA